MPLYEYQCDTCGSVFEVRQKFSDEPLSVHENCGGRVRRLLSAPALQFKGSGWYVTDYARGGNGSKTSAASESSGSKKTDGSKSDASKSGSKTDSSGSSTSSSTTSETK